jgi:glucoamylase
MLSVIFIKRSHFQGVRSNLPLDCACKGALFRGISFASFTNVALISGLNGRIRTMTDSRKPAPGKPGVRPTWTSSAKDGVGTALSAASNVWFTLRRGVLTEIYFPLVDRPCTRNLIHVVTDHHDFCSDEERDSGHELGTLAPGVPAYRIVNTCKKKRYRIEKTLVSDQGRPVVLQQTRFVPLQGSLSDYTLCVLLNPHLGGQGAGNTGWVDDYKGLARMPLFNSYQP